MAVGRQRETTPRIGPLESWQRVDRDATGEDSNFKVARPRSELPLGLFSLLVIAVFLYANVSFFISPREKPNDLSEYCSYSS